jgi:hypothetical protein
MIQPQELRIGNYVFDIDGDVFQVGEILDIGVKFKKTSLSSRYEKIYPILLTEEILLKCGFLKDDNFYHLNNIWISNFYENYFSLDGFDETKIKHIHQLQNLYFDLTGEELTFKNPLIFVKK